MAVVSSFLVVALAASARIGASAEYRQTPHGLRLAQCVHTAEEFEAVLNEKDNGVEVFYPRTNRSVFHPALSECIEEANNLRNLFAWQDNAYDDYMDPSIGTFFSAYDLPNENPPDYGQLLYFFIGMVNFGSKLGETIIQPVVNYDRSGQYPAGWSMESWNCCPSGQSHESKNIKLADDAKQIPTLCVADGNNINVTMSYEGQTTSLVQKQGGRLFNYIDVTLEEYDVTNRDCAAFTKGVFNFTKMLIVDVTGKPYSPNWTIQDNEAASCNGKTIQYDKYNIGIVGTTD